MLEILPEPSGVLRGGQRGEPHPRGESERSGVARARVQVDTGHLERTESVEQRLNVVLSALPGQRPAASGAGSAAVSAGGSVGAAGEVGVGAGAALASMERRIVSLEESTNHSPESRAATVSAPTATNPRRRREPSLRRRAGCGVGMSAVARAGIQPQSAPQRRASSRAGTVNMRTHEPPLPPKSSMVSRTSPSWAAPAVTTPAITTATHSSRNRRHRGRAGTHKMIAVLSSASTRARVTKVLKMAMSPSHNVSIPADEPKWRTGSHGSSELNEGRFTLSWAQLRTALAAFTIRMPSIGIVTQPRPEYPRDGGR